MTDVAGARALPVWVRYLLGAALGAAFFLLAYWVLVLAPIPSMVLGYLLAAAIVYWLFRDDRAAFLAPVLLIIPLVPFYLPPFEAANVVVLAIVAIGLNILTGNAGQISLGHGALVAVGAYTTAILMADYSWPWWTTIPLAGVTAAAVGFLLGLPSLRLTGPYLAIATLGLAIIFPILLKKYEGLTHGVQGIRVRKPAPPDWLGDLSESIAGETLLTTQRQDIYAYLIALIVGVVMVLLAWNIMRGRTGRAFMALRDSEVAAQVMGISLAVYKTLAFVVSAFFAGIGGALYAILVGFVSPDGFTLLFSIQFLVMIVVGGLASIPGAIIGALLVFELGLRIAPDINDALLPEQAGKNPWLVYGVVLILMMIFAPAGAWGLARRGWAFVLRRLPIRTAGAPVEIPLEAPVVAGPVAKTAERQ